MNFTEVQRKRIDEYSCSLKHDGKFIILYTATSQIDDVESRPAEQIEVFSLSVDELKVFLDLLNTDRIKVSVKTISTPPLLNYVKANAQTQYPNVSVTLENEHLLMF